MNRCIDSKLLSYLYSLVACSSTTGTVEEIRIEKEIFNLISRQNYLRVNPQNLMLHPIPGDRYGRSAVVALIKGRGKKTVILLGHHDAVDTTDYGPYREYALDPENLLKKLDPAALDTDARNDLESGEWIFGRGTADMKAGIALFINLLQEMGDNADEIEGNLLFVSVPDEETNSAGMIGSVPFLNRLSETRDLEYVCLINSEPCSFSEDGTYNIYTGSIGKMLPLVFCFGREAHAREPFEGINSNLIMSEIIREIEGNAALSDRYQDEITMPPSCLRAADLKDAYSVSTPPASMCYFNMLTYRRSPGETISILREIAELSFERALNSMNKRIRKYNSISGSNIKELGWEPKIYTYAELYGLCLDKHGRVFKEHMEDFIRNQLGRSADERDLTVNIVKEVHSFCPDRNPKIVIAFAPPYYPHVTIRGKDGKEKHVLAAVEKLKGFSARNLGISLKANRFFNGISDLSYCGIQDAEDVINLLKPNMPAWGHPYSVPVEEIKKLNVPAVILGPWGKDLHKFTERINRKFYLETAPKLLRFYVNALLNIDKAND